MVGAVPSCASAFNLCGGEVQRSDVDSLAGEEDGFLAFRGAELQRGVRLAEEVISGSMTRVLGPLERVDFRGGLLAVALVGYSPRSWTADRNASHVITISAPFVWEC